MTLIEFWSLMKNESAIEDVYRISKKPLGTGAYGVVSKCQHLETKVSYREKVRGIVKEEREEEKQELGRG